MDQIIVKSISRFSRNAIDCQEYINTLKDNGVRVFFERERLYGDDTQCTLILKLLSAAAQEESNSISQTIKWSIATQMSTYNRIISQHPDWELVEIYKDKGKTGTNTKKRLDFNRMLDDAKEGNIDLILVKSVSRFSRNTIDLLEYHTLSKRNGYLFLLTTYKKQNPPKTSVIDGLRNIY